MFTGIIEEVGAVEHLEKRASGAALRIRATTITRDAKEGDSISVSGVCLTARAITADAFSADLSPETLNRTALRTLRAGSQVNLERALLPTTRLGGHIVQGHVDGVGKVESLRELGDGNWWLTIEIPNDLEHYCVFKGSISVDGVSLTIAALEGKQVSAAVIPHTYANTTMREYRRSQPVNLEIDILAKYVEKMLAARDMPVTRPKSELTEEKLRELGY
ncbi:MAG: riboflavin synthase [Bryobacterales bacterium]|nr:riboflavin synthase [Bryobacterales bacterium]